MEIDFVICYNGYFYLVETKVRLVFKNSSNILIFKFLLAYRVSWGCNVFLIWLITLSGQQNMYVIGGICAMISYVLMKYFVFKKSIK